MKRQKPSKVKSNKQTKLTNSKFTNASSTKLEKKSDKKIDLSKIDWKIWILLGLVIFLIFAVLINSFVVNMNANVITGFTSEGSTQASKEDSGIAEKTDWDQVLRDISGRGDLTTINPVFPTILKAIFGSPVHVKDTSGEQDAGTSALSAIVLTICAWLLIFLTFSDIIGMFSTFSKGISWAIGFLLATILAQFNWQMGFIITLSKVLNITGTSLVFIGLLFAFAAFALLNLGIFPALNRFLLMRRASMTAHTAAAKGQEIGGAIAALDSIAKELKKEHKAGTG